MDNSYEIEELMTDFQFPIDEADGDVLEAMKEAVSEQSDFKKWFKESASKSFKAISGIDSFINFIAELPEGERKHVQEILANGHILGNPTLEMNFMLRYGLPHVAVEYYEGMKLLSDELSEINQAAVDGATRNIALLQSVEGEFAKAVNKAVQVACREIEQKNELASASLEADLQKHRESLQAFVKKTEFEINNIKEGWAADRATWQAAQETELEKEKTKARNIVYKEISKKVEEVVGNSFNKVSEKYTLRNAIYNAGAVLAAMTVFTLVQKLLS